MMTSNSEKEGEKPVAPVRVWRTYGLRLAAIIAILFALHWLARDAGTEIKSFETWIDGHGFIGLVAFIVVSVILTSVFVPSSILSAVAGAVFGLGWGTVVMTIAAISGALLDYAVANRFLRDRISTILEKHPRMLAIRRVMQTEGGRLQFMLRLAPLSAVSVSYVLGSAGVRFSSFCLGVLGLIPGLFVEVYFGHAAKHVVSAAAGTSPHSQAHLVLTITGFIVCMFVMIGIGRMAKRAIETAEASLDSEDADPEKHKS